MKGCRVDVKDVTFVTDREFAQTVILSEVGKHGNNKNTAQHQCRTTTTNN